MGPGRVCLGKGLPLVCETRLYHWAGCLGWALVSTKVNSTGDFW
jgi:hypothetical protein